MVDNKIHDILTAVENVVIPRVELSIVSPNTTSVRGYRSGIINNPDHSDFTENMEESPLMNASVAVYPRSLRAYRKERTSPNCLKITRNCINTFDFSISIHIIILP